MLVTFCLLFEYGFGFTVNPRFQKYNMSVITVHTWSYLVVLRYTWAGSDAIRVFWSGGEPQRRPAGRRPAERRPAGRVIWGQS